MDRPIWLLDVDGVINASRAGWSRAPRSTYARADGREYRIRWEPALTTKIRLMHASGLVDVMWATTWVDHAAEIERVLSLPSFPIAFTLNGDPMAARQRKRDTALALHDAGHRLIWTDDDAFTHWQPASFLESAGHLLIAPNPNRGLRPEDMDRISAWLTAAPAARLEATR